MGSDLLLALRKVEVTRREDFVKLQRLEDGVSA
jgi:hypothetical protein